MKRFLLLLVVAGAFGATVGCDDKKDSPAASGTAGAAPTKGQLPAPPPPPPKP